MKEKAKKIYMIFWYFVIFSILGLIVETVYCYATTGVIESRKGLLWGPFCPVYGVGATVLIILLDRYKNNLLKLFVFGGIVGDLAEYVMSYGLEAIYSTRFWDYSYIPLHLNGRISITYTIFWGILAVVLIKLVKPLVDKLVEKIPEKLRESTQTGLGIFLIVDVVCTIWGMGIYKQRAFDAYYQTGEEQELKKKIESSSFIEERLFSNKTMKKVFPNLRFIDKEGKEIFVRDVI